MTFPSPAPPLGFAQLSSFSAATGFSSVPAGAQFVVLSIEGETCRYRDDGNAPTSSDGVLLPLTSTLGEPWVYSSPGGLTNLQFIPTTGSATINAIFYGGVGF